MSNKKKSEKQKSSVSTQQTPRPATGQGEKSSSTKPSISQYVSFGLLLGIIAVVSFVFFEVMAKFLVPLFLAAILVVVFRPLHRWILEKSGGREKLSAMLTTTAVLVVFLLPLGTLLVVAAVEARDLFRGVNSTELVDSLLQARAKLQLDMPCATQLRSIESNLAELQNDNTPAPDVEYDHRVLLYTVDEEAESIAKQLEIPWIPDADDSLSSTESSNWEKFTNHLRQTRRLHHKMVWDGPEQQKAFHDYQMAVNETAESFGVFKTDLLGGKTSAWLKELANPSNAETESYISSAIEFARDHLLKIGGAGAAFFGNLLVGSAIMIIGLYFFLLDGPNMIETFKGLSPIDDEHEQELVTEFSKVSRAVVVATLLSALVQGLLAGIGFYFAGLEPIFLLTVLSAVLAMVPFVGAASVWAPCSLYLYFVQGETAAAVGLAIFGVAVISMADNVIKPMILHGQSNLHPLLALLSVLGGVAALGPIGILVGPMVVAFLQTLLKILQREMTDLDQIGLNDQHANS